MVTSKTTRAVAATILAQSRNASIAAKAHATDKCWKLQPELMPEHIKKNIEDKAKDKDKNKSADTPKKERGFAGHTQDDAETTLTQVYLPPRPRLTPSLTPYYRRRRVVGGAVAD